MKQLNRLLAALAREGLDVTCKVDGAARTWSVRLQSAADAPAATVLLPDGFPVEGKALQQLAALAAARHPGGGRVARACASPDFHPGDAGVAIGSVAAQEGMLIPAAVGSDINCGMRLHTVGLTEERFRSSRDRFVSLMKGDFFFGTRDLPLAGRAFRALFREGLLGFLDEMKAGNSGAFAKMDIGLLERELDRVFGAGSFCGNARWAPEDLVFSDDDVLRDGGLATIGGGNHFVEVQVVDDVFDPRLAYEWGVARGSVAFMIHSGSRHVGKHVGGAWRDRAKAAWPKNVPHPRSDLFALSATTTPELVASYLEAEATAANYGFLNRLLLAELVRARLREVFGDIEAPLIYDVPHNITLQEGGAYVVRKGACPAHDGQPVIIPGSMGAPSFLLVGTGDAATLCSASHGAGRARSRFSMGRRGARGDDEEEALGLLGVDCITLREERRIEEAPAAYKPIQPVIDVQVAAGSVRPVARLRPILTFKS